MQTNDLAHLVEEASMVGVIPGTPAAPTRHRWGNRQVSEHYSGIGRAEILSSSFQVVAGCLELRAECSRRMVLENLSRARSSVQVSCGRRLATGTVVACEDLNLRIVFQEAVWESDCVVTVELHGVSFALLGNLVGDIDEYNGLLSNLRVFFRNRRRSTRIKVGRGEGSLRWAHLVNGAPQVVARPVIDLVPNGVRIEVDEADVIPSDVPFVAELCLGNARVPLMANVLPDDEAAHNAKSARLQLSSGAGHTQLVAAYLKRRFPRLIPRRQLARLELAALLEISGYLGLRAGEGVSEAWAQFEADYSVDVAYRADDGTLLGHISATRAYSATYVFHQLATLGGHRETGRCRRMLYEIVGAVPQAFDGPSAFALAYFDVERRWHQLLFTQYVEWLSDARLGVVFVWDRFERDPGVSVSIAITGDAVVGALRQEDMVPAVALIRSQLPPLASDALDIFPQRLVSSSLNGSKARTRTALSLRVKGELVGIALCETGPSAASLFNLFNMAQFFFCVGASRPDISAQLALLAEVRRFYAARSVNDPIVVAPAGTFAAQEEPGTRLVERMGSIVLAGEGVRHWESYCSFAMGSIYARNQSSRRARQPMEMGNA